MNNLKVRRLKKNLQKEQANYNKLLDKLERIRTAMRVSMEDMDTIRDELLEILEEGIK